jgi:hypothetical protein
MASIPEKPVIPPAPLNEMLVAEAAALKPAIAALAGPPVFAAALAAAVLMALVASAALTVLL